MEEDNMSMGVELFFSYSIEDQGLRDKLEQHLSILKNQNIISTWHDRKIMPGREWAEEISEKLNSAQIILLLISDSFLSSGYYYNVEMTTALKRHEQGDAVVIPIILRPVLWESTQFGKLKALPKNGRAVTKWSNRDEAFKNIASGIAEVAKTLIQQKTTSNNSISTTHSEERGEESLSRSKTSKDIISVLKQMKFVFIKPGKFLMGSEETFPEENPIHEVSIVNSFYIGAYVVTQGEWKNVMGTAPWEGSSLVKSDDDYPAVYVSWEDAKSFIAKSNASDPENYYRLPTESEWEYAARAGTSTKFSFGDDERSLNAYGWYDENCHKAGIAHSRKVGQKRPNAWGLYDIHGNIWEWVEDWFSPYLGEPNSNPTQKVLRGGGYDFPATGARSAFRNKELPIRSNHVIGFRIVKEPL